MQIVTRVVEAGFAGPDLTRMLTEVGGVAALGDALSFIAASKGFDG
jgi:hypothetical protein